MRGRERRRGLTALWVGLMALAAFWVTGLHGLQGFVLDLGSLYFPRPRHVAFLALWGVFGGAAVFGLCLAFGRLWGSERLRELELRLARLPERTVLLLLTAFAFLAPLLVRTFVTEGAAITDDETAYLFQARLLATGQLTGLSHELKLFFDHVFLINDGSTYGIYFLGWPALLAPGAAIGSPELMNPIYAAATVPAVYGIARRNGGPLAGGLAALFFVSSPMVLAGAATLESHTSVIFALAWGLSLIDRLRFSRGGLLGHAGAAFFLCLAFFIRPQVVLPLALPFVVLWAMITWRRPDRLKAALAFALPTVVMAGLFLVVLDAQTGSPLKPGYSAYLDYSRANHFRFSLWKKDPGIAIPSLRFSEPLARLSGAVTGIFRSSFALLGWPSAFLLLPFAWRRRSATVRTLWVSMGLFVLAAVFGADPGVDAFGPVHWFELLLPLVILSGVGLGSLRLPPRWRAYRLPGVAALLLTAAVGYTPVRLMNLARLSEAHLSTFRLLDEAELGRALVFSPHPFQRYCGKPVPTRGALFWHPINDPELENERIYVNDLGPAQNQKLLPFFPDRKAVRLVWRDRCKLEIVPVAPLTPAESIR